MRRRPVKGIDSGWPALGGQPTMKGPAQSQRVLGWPQTQWQGPSRDFQIEERNMANASKPVKSSKAGTGKLQKKQELPKVKPLTIIT